MKANMQSDPYSIQYVKEQKKLEQERLEKRENTIEAILEELKYIRVKIDRIESKMNI